jgi:hypothetical protein
MKPTLTSLLNEDTDAPMQMMEILYGSLVTQLLSTAAELGLADLVADGPRPVEELAEKTDTHPGALYRAMRALAGLGVFSETAPRTFGLTPLASTLRSDVDGTMRDIARTVGSPERHRSYGDLLYSVRTGKPSFDHVHGRPLWSYLLNNPAHAATFNDGMGNLARHVHAAAVEGVDLSGVETLVDVGGGQGHLVATILPHYPDLKAIVYDEPHVVKGAEPIIAAAGLTDRVELQGGDMAESVPSGGDAYVLSSILFSYDDDEARTILENVRRAMTPGGRLMVLEPIIPVGDTPHLGKMLDIVQLVLQSGGSRTETEFAALFESAGLRLADTKMMAPNSPTDLVTAVAA